MKKLTITGMIYAVAWVLLLMPSLVNAQTMKLIPTFESIGIELSVNVDENSLCKVKFRPNGGEWRDGLNLFVDRYTDSEDRDKGFRGSIVLLEPDTEYEVELCYGKKGGNCTPVKDKVRTWKEEFTGTRFSVSNRADLMRKLKSGSSGNYMIFDGENKAVIDAGTRNESAINLENLSYVVLRNMKITGGKKSAVFIKNAKHIVIENCNIYEWGDDETYCGSDYNGFVDGGKIGGVYVYASSQVIVQRNKIHDPIANSCNWSSVPQELQDRKKDRISSHPAGPRGIALVEGVTESVFRYNYVYSDYNKRATHYFSDIFNAEERGAKSDIDVYGNDFGNGWDDGIEIEGLNRNIRVWNNAIHDVYQGVASDRNTSPYHGPVYIWRNIITNLSKSPNDTKGQLAGFKLDNGVGKGGIYLFNNTISGLGNPAKDPFQGVTNSNQYNFVMKNNIFEVSDKVFRNNGTLKPSSGDLNYNAYSNEKSKITNRSDWNKDWEDSGQFGVSFKYKKGEREWDYYALDSGDSKAQNAGTRVPNFIETPDERAPDLGAAQKDVWSMCVGLNGSRECSNGVNTPSEPNPPTTDPKEPVLVPQASVSSERANSLEQSYWQGLPAYSFTDQTGKSDNQVSFKALWDEQYLVIGVAVKDATLQTLAGDSIMPWKNDAIDLLFDSKSTKSTTWDHTLGHRQVIVDISRKQHSTPKGFGNASSPHLVIAQDGKGYFYEVRVPWASLADKVAQEGDSIGFDLANHDLDASGKTQFTYTQRTSEFLIPSQFAKLVLSGAQAAFPAANQWYFLENREYGKRLDIDNCSADGPVDMATGTNTDKQWRFVSVGEGYYALENECSGRWLTTTGEQISLQAGSSAAKKTHWKLIAVEAANASESGWYFLRNREEGNHLDADPSGSVDANNPGDNPDKQWRLIPVGQENARTGLAEKTTVVTPGAEVRQLLVYPNPSSEGHAHLQLSGFGAQAQVQIVDAKGQVVYQGVHTESQINLAQRFPGGLYVVRVSDARGSLTQKLLIE